MIAHKNLVVINGICHRLVEDKDILDKGENPCSKCSLINVCSNEFPVCNDMFGQGTSHFEIDSDLYLK